MKELIKNYISTMIFILFGYFFYTSNNYYKDFFIKDINFLSNNINSLDIFHIIILLYAVLLIPFYLLEKEKSKARIVLGFFKEKIQNPKTKISKEQKNSILSWVVKLFFLPMMIVWLSGNVGFVIDKGLSGYNEINLLSENFIYYFNFYFIAGILALIFTIDLTVFTFGYMLESKYLGNKIKSVEPTMLGWTVALICYPPFNVSIENILGWYSTNYPSFENLYVHITLNIIMLITFAIYTRASIALGLKASNLTNRGIISRGPYKYIRHPAYTFKVLSRFLGSLPIIILNIKNFDIKILLLIFISITVRGYIYYLRAITEEKHLEQDPDYLEYQKKVKYKFIPRVY